VPIKPGMVCRLAAKCADHPGKECEIHCVNFTLNEANMNVIHQVIMVLAWRPLLVRMSLALTADLYHAHACDNLVRTAFKVQVVRKKSKFTK
jgi:hypothetical protein